MDHGISLKQQFAFHTRVQPNFLTGCLDWAGTLDQQGYGRTSSTMGGTGLAHRVAWLLAGRELPAAPLTLDHLCRNRACVNVDHLRVATPVEQVANSVNTRGAPATCVGCGEGIGSGTTREQLLDRDCGRCLQRAAVRKSSDNDIHRKARREGQRAQQLSLSLGATKEQAALSRRQAYAAVRAIQIRHDAARAA